VSWKSLKYREIYLAVAMGAVLDSGIHQEVVDYLSTNVDEYEGLLGETIRLDSPPARHALLGLIAEAAERMARSFRRQNVCQAVVSAQLH
jgi:hypothetical protein